MSTSGSGRRETHGSAALDSLALGEVEMQRLARALGTTPESDEFAARVEALTKEAVREVVDWILARRRFESISALERHRILHIFGKIRREAPNVESLSNELDITESRAVSLVSRMRFGAARLIRALQYESAKEELEAQLATSEEHSGRKYVWVRAETGRLVEEANTAIMMDQAGRRAGGRYEGAEKAERVDATRTGQSWAASERMWEYIRSWLQAQADEAGEGLLG